MDPPEPEPLLAVVFVVQLRSSEMFVSELKSNTECLVLEMFLVTTLDVVGAGLRFVIISVNSETRPQMDRDPRTTVSAACNTPMFDYSWLI